MKLSLPVAFVAAASAMVGCSEKPEVVNTTDLSSVNLEENVLATGDGESYSDQTDMTATEPQDAWIFNDETDAMSDARILKAGHKIAGQNNDIEVMVVCNPTAFRIRYEISGFGKTGEPSEMTNRQSGGLAGMRYQIRRDAAPAVNAISIARYNNQIIVDSRAAVASARANTLTLRLAFLNAVETYIIDQNSNNFRAAVEPCLTAGEAQQAKSEAYQKQQVGPPPTQPTEAVPADEATDTALDNTSM